MKSLQAPTHRPQIIHIEGYDPKLDYKLIKETIVPYMKDLFNDLAVRSSSESEEICIDKVTFFEYCSLPGIINDRFLRVFDPKGKGVIKEERFVEVMIMVFISELDDKMRLTFEM